MALKITTQIGTNRGLTSEAYVRIANYEIMKTGVFKIGLQIYQSEQDANQPIGQTPLFKESVSYEIGSVLAVPLLKDVTVTVTKKMPVDELSTIMAPVVNAEGVTTGTEEREIMTKVLKDVEVEETIKVPDLSILEGQDIFEFGYTKVKEKLVQLYGADNVIDY